MEIISAKIQICSNKSKYSDFLERIDAFYNLNEQGLMRNTKDEM